MKRETIDEFVLKIVKKRQLGHRLNQRQKLFEFVVEKNGFVSLLQLRRKFKFDVTRQCRYLRDMGIMARPIERTTRTDNEIVHCSFYYIPEIVKVVTEEMIIKRIQADSLYW